MTGARRRQTSSAVLRWVAAPALVLALTAGCGANGGVESSPLGDELIIATHAENQAMQAQQTYKEVNSPGLRNVIEQLVGIDPDTGEHIPMLATSWEQIDPLTWRFELRQGVEFHDGSPFNAEAAAFAVNWVWSADNSFHIRETMGPQISAEVVDEYTIDVKTPIPDPLIPDRMYLGGISSMQQLLDDPSAADQRPIGTGPYRFIEWRQGQFWTAELNEDWWGFDAEDAYGQPTYERLRFVFRPEASVRAAMVETGEAHFAMFVTPEQCAAAQSREGTDCTTATSDSYLFLRPDVTGAHPAFQDIRVRQAIFHAIDRQAIIDNVMGEGTYLAGQMLADDATGYAPDVGDYAYDPDLARQLLDEARADGVPVDDANVLVAARVASVPRIGEIIEAIGGMLDAVGLPNRVELQEQGQIIEWFLTRPGPERANILVHPGGNPTYDYALTLRALYHCETIVSMYCDPDFDQRLEEASQRSGDERVAALQDLVRELHDEYVMLPIALIDWSYAHHEDLDWRFTPDQRLVAVHMATR
jgi:peptide/nickel transport system substrate-binding protein